jgi:hypothetical protein
MNSHVARTILLAASLGSLFPVAPIAAHGQNLTYEITVDSIRPYRTRGQVDRDFLTLTQTGVAANPQPQVVTPQSVGQMFADNVRGDQALRSAPLDANGQPVFRLKSWVNTDSENLIVSYSLVDLSHDTYQVSAEKFHKAVKYTEGLIYSGAASVLDLVGDHIDAVVVGVMGAVTGAITEGFADLFGLDDPRSYSCDGVVLADTITLSGRQLYDMTENASHSFPLNDARLLQLSHSNGITATEHGSGYMGVGDAPRACGSRSLYEINITVRRLDTSSPPPTFVNQLGSCDARTLQPADSAPRAAWNGAWADASQRIKVQIDGQAHLMPEGLAWRYKINSREGESSYGRMSRYITENVDTATLSNTMTVPHFLDQYCCSSQLVKGISFSPPSTGRRSAVSNVRTTQAMMLPDKVQLQLFEGCLASAPRSEKYHLRYMRTDAEGKILSDVLLSGYQAPPR